jgi:hypothetical protein
VLGGDARLQLLRPASPRSIASSSDTSSDASFVAARLSLSPGLGGDSSSTAAVPTTDASNQPARRSGIMLTVPGEAAGST